MNWIKKLFSNAPNLTEGSSWNGLVSKTNAGQSVDVTSAMKTSTVYGCVRILSEGIAALPLKIYEKTEKGKEIAEHPLNNIFQLPNSIQTGFELKEFMVSSLVLRGNFFCQKVMSNRGVLGEIIPLYPQHMNIDKDATGRLVFDYQEPGATKTFSQSEIWRCAGLSSNGVTGLSPITQARESIGFSMALEQHGATLFKNGTQTDSVFEIPTSLTDVGFERLKEQLAQYQGAGNAHKPMILEAGLVRKNIGMTSEDSQFIETRKLQVADIARYFRVPLHMLNELDKATFSNIEHQSIEFVRDTLTPWLVRIEQSIFRDLLTPAERGRYFAKHSIEGMLRGDIKSRYEAYGKGITDGWLSRNEVRDYEDKNRVEGLDDYIMPLNMATNAERESAANTQNAAINDLVGREVRALKADINNTPSKFVDFYKRHLNTSSKLLGVDTSKLMPYAENRLAMIENGLTQEDITVIANNGATEIKELLCKK